MAVPTTNISLHLITALTAVEHSSFGKPLILRLESRYGGTDITLFFEDESLTHRLVEAINAAVKGPVPKLVSCPHEAAAYDALAAYGFPELR